MELHYALRRPLDRSLQRPALLMLLHGLNGNETGAFEVEAAFDPRFLVLCPRAPHETAPGRYRWFDTDLVIERAPIDAGEAEASRRALVQFVNDAVMGFGVDPRLVFVLGFSQGAMMVYSLALTAPRLLRAVVAIAGRVLPELAPIAAPGKQIAELTFLLQHGRRDPVVPLTNGLAARDLLIDLNAMLGFREYDASHELTPEILNDAAEFLSVQLDRAILPRNEH